MTNPTKQDRRTEAILVFIVLTFIIALFGFGFVTGFMVALP